MILVGIDFVIDGTSVGYGTLTSNQGYLNGTLQNGDPIDVYFEVGSNASITLIPEPATLLLLSLGAAIVKRKKDRANS